MFVTFRRLLPAIMASASALLTVGCGEGNVGFMTEDRLANGLVIILPGIEGESEINRNIRRGLLAGGVNQAMPIHKWGRPIPIAGPLINQVDFLGNRLAGVTVANMVVNYQDSNPGKPVHIVGHSGGGGVAVFAAEALPEGRKLDGLILLSASISSAYDLTKAAGHCTSGIVNFHNPDDTGLLGIGTTVLGNVDGIHGPSAGLLGTDCAGKPGCENVYQVRLGGMDASDDPHTSTTRIGYVAGNVVPWILSDQWPPPGGFDGRLADRPTPPRRSDPPDKAVGKVTEVSTDATSPATQRATTAPAGVATRPAREPQTKPAAGPETKPAKTAKPPDSGKPASKAEPAKDIAPATKPADGKPPTDSTAPPASPKFRR